jgi:cytochrome c oxidase cbb3-type subunit I/II
MLYWLFPRLYQRELYSKKLANFHFWIGSLGILFYALPMYWAGFMQSLMWKEFTQEGLLAYPNFLQTVTQLRTMYMLRALGGALFISGVVVMAYNLIMTARAGVFVANEPAEVPALPKVIVDQKGEHWHRWIERRPIQMLVGSLVVVLIGGIVEIIPTFLVKSNIPTISSVKPYSALELHGRDLYIKEGCNNCHTQMVRPFRSETERYKGEYSKAGEFVYDHPFLWGSKRTGPDLHRVGAKYSDSWHYDHLLDPEIMSPGSIMPSYPWLFEKSIDTSLTRSMISAMRTLGVPYPEGYEAQANKDLLIQGNTIVKSLEANKIRVTNDKEIVALIAYLQRLGTDIKVKKTGSLTSNK